jgi:hypothetical protein
MFLRRLDDNVQYEYRDCPDCRTVDDDSIVEDPLKPADISLLPTRLPTDYHELWKVLFGERQPEADPELKEDGRFMPRTAEVESALERWGEQCAIDGCGVTNEKHENMHGRRLFIHHNVPRKDWLNRDAANQWSNLIPVCWQHHGHLEQYLYEGSPDVRQQGRFSFPTKNPHEFYQTLRTK